MLDRRIWERLTSILKGVNGKKRSKRGFIKMRFVFTCGEDQGCLLLSSSYWYKCFVSPLVYWRTQPGWDGRAGEAAAVSLICFWSKTPLQVTTPEKSLCSGIDTHIVLWMEFVLTVVLIHSVSIVCFLTKSINRVDVEYFSICDLQSAPQLQRFNIPLVHFHLET